jgi:hypothetical protein
MLITASRGGSAGWMDRIDGIAAVVVVNPRIGEFDRPVRVSVGLDRGARRTDLGADARIICS